MTGNSNPKVFKNLLAWYKKSGASSKESEHQESGPRINMPNISVESVNEEVTPPLLNSVECGKSARIEDDEDIFDINSLERDPGKRRAICKYPVNDHDNVRRAYVVLGPYQPRLNHYPSTWDGVQNRKFSEKWFKDWPWLEYSIIEDKAYCFPCFLFKSNSMPSSQFTDIGFNGWKNIKSRKSGVFTHIGGVTSTHNSSIQKWDNLKNPSKHIERVICKLSAKEVEDNRTRLVTTIEVVKLLALQGISFRGHDESKDSLNGGNFDAILKLMKRVDDNYRKALINAPKNAKYTSSTIQKQVANILGNQVRAKIREEVGESKFCILIDEALDVANKEQMAIILRFVDCNGLIRERFFKLISVPDTCSLTLKNEISKVLAQYDLKEENLRGQGYDGASNMRGKFNGLQALFLKEYPQAYFVHCFAHRLQLTLNAAAQGVSIIWQFFSTLTTIVNFIDSSAKRHSMLKDYREAEIQDLVAIGTNLTGKGKNQACTLQRAGATRWGSHFRSISSLIKLFGATQAIVEDLHENGLTEKVRGEARGIGDALTNYEFVHCLILMHEVMKITEFLSQTFQKKDIDIVNAVEFLSITKRKLQNLRDDGWVALIKKVDAFCSDYNITTLDMSAPYRKRKRGSERNVTNEHYYRVDVLYVVIDHQLLELDSRFGENCMELLVLSASFHPRNDFQAFKAEDVCKLASKFYPSDFLEDDIVALGMECEFFLLGIKQNATFANATSISDLCRLLVTSGKSSFYPMMYRLICLILTLPVSTATTERAFSSMKIIKNRLRNKMDDDFLDDLMVLYIERSFVDCISNDDVITEFEVSGTRRVREINLLRESNMQLREENKHNFEECQKLRETVQKNKTTLEHLQSLLMEKENELEACRKEIERYKTDNSLLENKVSELLQYYQNIDVSEYNHLKEHLNQIQAEKFLEMEANKKLVCEKQDLITRFELDVANRTAEIKEKENRINEISKVEEKTKIIDELDKHKQALKSLLLDVEKAKQTNRNHLEGNPSLQLLTTNTLDESAASVLGSFDDLEKVAQSDIVDFGGSSIPMTTAAAPTSSAVTSDSAVAITPPSVVMNAGPSASQSRIGTNDEKERRVVMPKSSGEARRSGRRLIRPRLMKQEDPQGDVGMPEVDGTSGALNQVSAMDTETIKTSPLNERQRPALKRQATLSEAPELSVVLEKTVVSLPASKKSKVSYTSMEFTEETLAGVEIDAAIPAVQEQFDAAADRTHDATNEVADEEGDAQAVNDVAAEVEPERLLQQEATAQAEIQNDDFNASDEPIKQDETEMTITDDSQKEQEEMQPLADSDREEGELDSAGPDAEDGSEINDQGSPPNGEGQSETVASPTTEAVDEGFDTAPEADDDIPPELVDRRLEASNAHITDEVAKGNNRSNDGNDNEQGTRETDVNPTVLTEQPESSSKVAEGNNGSNDGNDNEQVTREIDVNPTVLTEQPESSSKVASNKTIDDEESKKPLTLPGPTTINLNERARVMAQRRQAGMSSTTETGSAGRGVRGRTLRGRVRGRAVRGRGQAPPSDQS